MWSQLFTEGRYRDPSLAEKLLPMINGPGRVKKPPMFEGAGLDLLEIIFNFSSPHLNNFLSDQLMLILISLKVGILDLLKSFLRIEN